ncbi:MAG: shikimate kinase [Actinomycetota bacterium]
MNPGHVYLIGMPGSGKSAVGRALAERLDMPFVDLDEEIEREAGQTIPEIFREQGERGFRERERASVVRVADGPPSVVACGGGAVLREDNRQLIRSTGRVVWLRSAPDRLWERVKRGAGRPLIKGPVDVQRLERERRSIYGEVAQHRVASEGPPEDVARSIAEVLT